MVKSFNIKNIYTTTLIKRRDRDVSLINSLLSICRWFEGGKPDGSGRTDVSNTGIAELGFGNLLFPLVVAALGVVASVIVLCGERAAVAMGLNKGLFNYDAKP